MSDVQSISSVNTSDGWAVCQVNGDGTRLFVIPDAFEPRFTQEGAQLAAEHLRQHLESGGHTYAKPLPPGVSVLG